MKNFAKILAMLLVLTMCMSLFCISAFADEISELEPDDEIEEVQPAAEEPAAEEPAAEQPAAEEPAAEEPAAEQPAGPAVLEEDEEEEEPEAPSAPVIGLPAEENSAGSQNTFKGTPTLTPDTVTAGTAIEVAGYSDDLQSFTTTNDVILTYTGPVSGTCGVYDWCLVSLKNGTFYLGKNFVKSLPVGTYEFTLTSLKDGSSSDPASFTVEAPALSVSPLETPKHVLGSAASLSFWAGPFNAGGTPELASGIGSVKVGDVYLVEGRDFYLTDNATGDQTIITLSPYFLNKLTSGATYKMTITNTNGDIASTNFSIVGYGTSTSSPRTGDDSNIGLWAVLLLLSGTAAVVIVPRIKKHGI